ncbi:procathepsin L-like isoform X2 [Scylla paramamosain]|uniref:procathepsin L-like isoform X2 n=1 Tax=Scylla paramamosain TaxID=85552 RepID=UPI0030830E63
MVLQIRLLALLMGLATLCPARRTDDIPDDKEWEAFKMQYNKAYSSGNEEKIRRQIFFQNKMMIKKHNYRYAQNLTSFKVALNHLGDKTGSLEGQLYRHSQRLISMSEQNLIDCCHLCYGCSGGRMDYAFTYIMQNGGLDSEVAYPYEARDAVCRYHPSASVTRIRGYSAIPSGDENALKNAVALIGPIAVAIDASLSSFHYYTHGVYYDPHCSPTQLTHGALIVGYGRESGRDYWLVKNSWGTNWGDKGYIKMARNLNNNCGIATSASYPFL